MTAREDRIQTGRNQTGRIGAFELHEVVGRGSEATVYRASVEGAGAKFAVKVLDAEGRAGFQRELNAVARLDHPAIALVVDHGVVAPSEATGALRAGAPFIAMELARGTLAPLCGALDWPELQEILLRLLAALGHAHARGILHRDIKPQNLLLAEGGVQLTDFGLARIVDAQGPPPDEGPLVGTPAWMAPEQCEGTWRDHGPFTDLYAVGCVAWALASGHPPFGHGLAAIHAHLGLQPPRLQARCALPDGFEAWVRRLLEKEPGRRFDRAVLAAEALARLGDRAQVRPRGDERRSLAVFGAGLRLFGLREMPVIGRDPDLRALERSLEEVVGQRQPRALLLEGAAGVGKSHLARWLCELAHERYGLEVVRLVHSEVPDARHGWRSALVDALGCGGLTDGALARQAAKVLRLPEAHPLCRALGPWLDQARPQPASQDAIVGWIRHLCRGRGAVLSVDDLQWCDEGTLETLQVLLEDELPLLVVGTLQREALAQLPSRRRLLEAFRATRRVRTLPIGVLPPEQQPALVRALLPLEPDLVERVAERTAGNPLFARHLLADWVGRDLLEVGPQGLKLRVDRDPPLPASLAAAWQGWIERLAAGLSPAEQTALALAARLGQRVDAEEWQSACDLAGADPSNALVDRLIVSGVVDEAPRGLAFVHGMLRESLVSWSEAKGRGAELELWCGRALKRRTPLPYARIGRHLLAAGALEEALEPLYFGAAHEVQLGHWGATQALLAERERALAALGCDRSDPRWAEQLLVTTQIELRLHHNVAGARAAAHAARALLEGSKGPPGKLARAYQLLSVVDNHEGGVRSALHWLDEAARVADEPWLRSNLAAARLNALLTLGESLAQVEAELQRLLEASPADPAYILLQLAAIARRRADRALLAERTARAEALLRSEGRPDGIAVCLALRGDCARWAGDRALARALYAEAKGLLAHDSRLLLEPIILAEALLAEQDGERGWVGVVDALIEEAARAGRLETLTGAHPVRLLATVTGAEVDLEGFEAHASAARRWFARSGSRVPEAREALALLVERLERLPLERPRREALVGSASALLQLYTPI